MLTPPKLHVSVEKCTPGECKTENSKVYKRFTLVTKAFWGQFVNQSKSRKLLHHGVGSEMFKSTQLKVKCTNDKSS